MSQQNHSSSIPWIVIIPIILAMIFIPIIIHFGIQQNEEDEARMKNGKKIKLERDRRLNNGKFHLKIFHVMKCETKSIMKIYH